MPGQDMLDDRQTQAGAARFARATSIDAIEAFRQARQMVRLDADALILDTERTAAILAGFPGNIDRPARRGIAHGVAGKIAEGTVQLGAAAQQTAALGFMELYSVRSGG